MISMFRFFSFRFLIPLILLGCLAVLFLSVYLWSRASVPKHAGNLALSGFREQVSILRNRRGIPYIQADNEEDAYAALGFVHAQDRLWQMDSMRRLAAGRLSEILGPRGLPSDRMMRLFGFNHLVETQFQTLNASTRRILESYALGVNAWLRMRRQALPVEFAILDYAPEPWRPQDSLLWGKLMALQLSGNWRDELLRTRMLGQLPDHRVLSFWYPDRTPIDTVRIDTGQNQVAALPEIPDELLSLLPPLPSSPQGASNAWAVSGEFTESGRPLLANDPHLGFALPSTWYLARIETPSSARTGATVAGVPFLILGHNETVAWGMTATQSDLQDVFIERLSDDGQSYLDTTGRYLPFNTRQETIVIRGQADEVMTVRSTRRGPVISDLVGGIEGVVGADTVLSLAATFFDERDSTPDALAGMVTARNWRSFESALTLFHTPQVNIVYGDTGGTIAFAAPGSVPVRASGRGRFPVPGWLDAFAWTGRVPFQLLPRSINPSEGKLVSANNAIVADDYPYFLSDDWAPGYRATRIFQRLDALNPASLESLSDIQLDTVSEMARELMPLMTAFVPRDPEAAEALSRLAQWDGTMSKDAVEPLVFYAWLREVNRFLYADDLGNLFPRAFGLRPRFVRRVLMFEPEWCDDSKTVKTESCELLLESSLISALTKLKTMGKDGKPVRRWGDVHQATFRHPVLSGFPLVGQIWGERAIESAGGNYTINRAATRTANEEAPFADIHGPGFRAIYDFSDLSRSRFMIATGQSGNPFHENYDDMMPIWSAGHYVRLKNTQDLERENNISRLTLEPGPSAKDDKSVLDRLIPVLDHIMRKLGSFGRHLSPGSR